MKRKPITIIVAITLCVAIVVVSINLKSNVRADGENTEVEFMYKASASESGKVKVISDGVFDTDYFSQPSTVYNNDLALLSLQTILTAGCTAESYYNWGKKFNDIATTEDRMVDNKTSRNANIIDLYKKLEFKDDVYYKYDLPLNDESDTVACAMATKDIVIDKKDYKLVNVTVRSSTYGCEWASNFNLANNRGETGFSTSGKRLFAEIKQYVNEHNLGENTKIWITGFSRGGAVANVAAACIDRECESGGFKFDTTDVYAYTLAAPQPEINNKENDLHDKIYDNIFNIVNEGDIVPTTAPSAWGFDRYGRDYTFPALNINQQELDNIEKGKATTVDNATKKLVKNISYTYNEVRYGHSSDNKGYDMKSINKGFVVSKEMTEIIEIVYGILADDLDDYESTWQDAVLDIIPFITRSHKVYDSKTGKWVPYDSVVPYIKENCGEKTLEKAKELGVFREDDYNKKRAAIDGLYEYKKIDKNSCTILKHVIDVYYGLRIVAVNHNISVNDIKKVTTNALKSVRDILDRKEALLEFGSLANNHYIEYYYAWLKNYDIVGKKAFKNN